MFSKLNQLLMLRHHARIKTIEDHALVFMGDLLPYGLLFLMTVLLGFRFGLEAAGVFSLSYAYVAIVTTLVAGPNLLSIRRRMPTTASAGAVVLAALILRIALIGLGAVLALFVATTMVGMASSMSWIIGLLFVGRLLEVCIDAPATCVQYKKPARVYFFLRLGLFVLLVTIVGLGFATIAPAEQRAAVPRIAAWYLTGTGIALCCALLFAGRLFGPWRLIRAVFKDEVLGQCQEFGRFFVASAFFVAASRLHPVIILAVAGGAAAERFATIFNLFAVLSLAATGVAGVFFWSRNRVERDHLKDGVPRVWLLGAIPGGVMLGGLGGLAIQELFLRPLNAPGDMLFGTWLLCAATPFLITQSIVSNTLVLQKRDREMLVVSVINATLGLGIITLCVQAAGLVGACIAVGLSAMLATFIGAYVVSQNT